MTLGCGPTLRAGEGESLGISAHPYTGELTYAGQTEAVLRGNRREADHHVESTPVKYVMTVDYPVGGKADYIAWVTSVAADLQAPPELQRIASYDNYHGASPNRVIEMEFDSMADAAAYLENPAVRAVFDDLPNHGVNSSLNVFVKRSDYSKN